jgi:hypothetical protein
MSFESCGEDGSRGVQHPQGVSFHPFTHAHQGSVRSGDRRAEPDAPDGQTSLFIEPELPMHYREAA